MSRHKFLGKTNQIIKDIIDLKVQGASNVAFACQDVLVYELQNYKKDKNEFRKYFFDLCKALWKTRPTEPAMKHFLTTFYCELEKQPKVPLTILTKRLIKLVQDYKRNQEKAIDQIATNSLKLPIKHKAIIFTHCHSSIVENAIKHLHKLGKLDSVVNTETRPLYQGRITSKNLAKAGIKIFHIVDSCAYAYAKQLHHKEKEIFFLTGADVITRNGELVNKIGTSQISLAMNCLGIPHYVLTISTKIDPVSKNWTLNDVEIRNPKEIWNEKIKNIEVDNYAFDITQSHLIKDIITEKGITTSKDLVKHNRLSKKELEVWKEFEK